MYKRGGLKPPPFVDVGEDAAHNALYDAAGCWLLAAAAAAAGTVAAAAGAVAAAAVASPIIAPIMVPLIAANGR